MELMGPDPSLCTDIDTDMHHQMARPKTYIVKQTVRVGSSCDKHYGATPRIVTSGSIYRATKLRFRSTSLRRFYCYSLLRCKESTESKISSR